MGVSCLSAYGAASLPAQPGLNLIPEMMDAAKEAGSLRGLWAIGYDICLDQCQMPTRRGVRSQHSS